VSGARLLEPLGELPLFEAVDHLCEVVGLVLDLSAANAAKQARKVVVDQLRHAHIPHWMQSNDSSVTFSKSPRLIEAT
jgi:hypothetical protein